MSLSAKAVTLTEMGAKCVIFNHRPPCFRFDYILVELSFDYQYFDTVFLLF